MQPEVDLKTKKLKREMGFEIVTNRGHMEIVVTFMSIVQAVNVLLTCA